MAISLRQIWTGLPMLTRIVPEELKAWITRAPDRRDAVLAWVRERARAGDPESVLAAMDEFGRTQRFLMNVGDEKGPLLDATVRDAEATRVLELGCFCGYSAIRIARLLPADGKLVSVELDPHSAEIATAMVELAGSTERVEIRVGDSEAVIPNLEGPFDVVFLDHWKDVYLRDLQAIEQTGLLRDGSVVFADNVGPMFGAEAYLAYVRTSPQFASEYHESHIEYSQIEDGVEISTYRT